MNRHRNRYGAFLLVLAFVFVPFNTSAQNKQPSKPADKLVFEVVSNGWANGRVHAYTLRFYKTGRVIYEKASSRFQREKYRITGTSRVAAIKISELIELADQPDFLNAKDRYKAFPMGADWGNSKSVIYFRKSGKQTIELAPYRSRHEEMAEPLPESLKEFLSKVSEIAKNLPEGKLGR
jgi:hypothetical protein